MKPVATVKRTTPRDKGRKKVAMEMQTEDRNINTNLVENQQTPR